MRSRKPAPEFHPLLVRALRAHIRKARRLLAGRHGDPERIHILRTGIKKLRAYWRFVRPILPDATFRKESRGLRKTAHRLAALREAQVLRKTLAKLSQKADGDQPDRFSKDDWRHFESRLAAPDPGDAALGRMLDKALGELIGSVERFADRAPGTLDRDRFKELLVIPYRKAKRAGKDSTASGSPGFHGWRKRVKDLMYQLDGLRPLLKPARPADVFLQGLDSLQDALGDEHDLEVLSDFLRRRPGLSSGPGKSGTRKDLRKRREKRKGELRILAKRKNKLRRAARRMGKDLFGRKPRRYLDGIGAG